MQRNRNSMLLQNQTPTNAETAVSAEEATARINQALDASDFKTAYTWLEKLTRVTSDSTQVHTTAGLVALQLDRRDEAAGHFARALKQSPDDYVTNYNMALTEMHHERYDQALQRLRHLRRLDASNGDILNDMGVVWLQRNRPARALASFSRAMKIDPDNSMARNNAMELCLTNGLTECADKLLVKQRRNSTLTPKAQTEIHRWQQVLEDPGCPRAETTPVDNRQKD